LIKNIFSSAGDVVDMTDAQIKDQISGMFGEKEKLVVLPDSKRIEIKSGETGAFAVGIQNRFTGSASTTTDFRYEIKIAEVGNCPVSEGELLELIVTGQSIPATEIAPGGEPVSRKVTLSVREGFPLCSFSYQIDATHSGGEPYASNFMDVTIVA